jgi:hypothetical protein
VPGEVCTVVPASGSRTTWCRGLSIPPRMPVTAAAGMTVLLLRAVITHRRAAGAGKEMAPALLALTVTIAYPAVVLTSSA